MCPDVSRCVTLCQDVARSVKMCHALSRCVKVGQDVSRSVKICQNLSRPAKVWQDLSRSVPIRQDLSRCVKVCQDASRSVKMRQGVSRCVKICQDASRCVKMRQDQGVSRCVKARDRPVTSATALYDPLHLFRFRGLRSQVLAAKLGEAVPPAFMIIVATWSQVKSVKRLAACPTCTWQNISAVFEIMVSVTMQVCVYICVCVQN